MSDAEFDKKTFAKVSYEGEELEFRDTADTRNQIFNDLIKSIFIEGTSREAIADELGITLSDVKNLEKKALRAFYTSSIKLEDIEPKVERKRDSLDAALFKGRKYTLSA